MTTSSSAISKINPDSGKVTRSDILGIWFAAVGCAVAVVWSSISGLERFPLPGLRPIAADPLLAWLLFCGTLTTALFITVRKWQRRQRLLFLSGFLACSALVLYLYVSMGLGMFLGLLARDLYSNNA